MLADLGHRLEIAVEYHGERCDLLVALHAMKSAPSIERFHDERPRTPLIVALTGTDLYGDFYSSPTVRRSLDLADRLIVLQPRGVDEVPEHLRPIVRVILQSSSPVDGAEPPSTDRFEVCVLGHLRPVKDPFRAAEAAHMLPRESRIRVVHLGAALQPEMAARAEEEQRSNPRYTWMGDLPRDDALRVLARSRLLVLSSWMEGGANVVSESLVQGVPVLSTRIPGSIGLLGDDYPGYFPTGDSEALAGLLHRAETDVGFLDDLRERCVRLAPRFTPQRERDAWRALLEELAPSPSGGTTDNAPGNGRCCSISCQDAGLISRASRHGKTS